MPLSGAVSAFLGKVTTYCAGLISRNGTVLPRPEILPPLPRVSFPMLCAELLRVCGRIRLLSRCGAVVSGVCAVSPRLGTVALTFALILPAEGIEPSVLKDIEYAQADGKPLTLDLYLPPVEPKSPLIVWV